MGRRQQKPITQSDKVGKKLIKHCCTKGTKDISSVSDTMAFHSLSGKGSTGKTQVLRN